MTIREKLLNIQSELKAPKSQKNTSGNYSYRSCEDILEAVKPFLKEQKAILVLTDDIVQVGDRNYVKATAHLQDTESETEITNTAFAREEETKKEMDGSQITGASSSYARKYALNGLFAIDDTKDSDATNKHEKGIKPKDDEELPPLITPQQITRLKELGVNLEYMAQYYKVANYNLVTKANAERVIKQKEKELAK